jgi:hypothetical protein
MAHARSERGVTEPPTARPFQHASVTSTSTSTSTAFNRRHYRSKSHEHVPADGDFFAPGPPPPQSPLPSPELAGHDLPPLPAPPAAGRGRGKGGKAAKGKPGPKAKSQAAIDAANANTASHARKTPPGHIKRPPNAFILFRSHCCGPRAPGVPGAPHPQSHPGDVLPPPPPTTAQLVELGVTDHRHISRITSHLWRSLPAHEKAYWDALAETRKQEHAAAHPDYKYKPVYRDKEDVKRRKAGKAAALGGVEVGACEEVARAILDLDDDAAKGKGKAKGKKQGVPALPSATNAAATAMAVANLASKKKAPKRPKYKSRAPAPLEPKPRSKLRTKRQMAADEAAGIGEWEDQEMEETAALDAVPVRRGGRNKTAVKRSYAGMDDDDEDEMVESAVMALSSGPSSSNNRYSLDAVPSQGFAPPARGPITSRSFAPPRSQHFDDGFDSGPYNAVASGSGTFDPYNEERSDGSDGDYDPHPTKRARRASSDYSHGYNYPVVAPTAPIPTATLSLYKYNNATLPNGPPPRTAVDLEREHAMLKFEHERLKELHRNQATLLRGFQTSPNPNSRSSATPSAPSPTTISRHHNGGRNPPPPPIVLPSTSYLHPSVIATAPTSALISPCTIIGQPERRPSAPNSLAMMGMKRRGTLEYQVGGGGALMLISPSFGGYEMRRADWAPESSAARGGEVDEPLTAFVFEEGFMMSVMRGAQASAQRTLDGGIKREDGDVEMVDGALGKEYRSNGEPYFVMPDSATTPSLMQAMEGEEDAEGEMEDGKGQYVFLNRDQAENKTLVADILQYVLLLLSSLIDTNEWVQVGIWSHVREH